MMNREDSIYSDLIVARTQLEAAELAGQDTTALQAQVTDLTDHLVAMTEMMEQTALASPEGVRSKWGQRGARLRLLMHPYVIRACEGISISAAIHGETATRH